MDITFSHRWLCFWTVTVKWTWIGSLPLWNPLHLLMEILSPSPSLTSFNQIPSSMSLHPWSKEDSIGACITNGTTSQDLSYKSLKILSDQLRKLVHLFLLDCFMIYHWMQKEAANIILASLMLLDSNSFSFYQVKGIEWMLENVSTTNSLSLNTNFFNIVYRGGKEKQSTFEDACEIIPHWQFYKWALYLY